MADYAINDFTTVDGAIETVVANLETQLETLDSTNDPIVLIDVILLDSGDYMGILITS